VPKWIFGSPSLPIIYLKAANLWRVVGLAEDGTCEERIIVDQRKVIFMYDMSTHLVFYADTN